LKATPIPNVAKRTSVTEFVFAVGVRLGVGRAAEVNVEVSEALWVGVGFDEDSSVTVGVRGGEEGVKVVTVGVVAGAGVGVEAGVGAGVDVGDVADAPG
jgi:hypothetical protein